MNRDGKQEPSAPKPDQEDSWPGAGDSAPAWSLSGDAPPASDTPRYRLDRLLGEGGMGRVYVAEDRVLRRQVALKALSPSLLSDPQAHRRLSREALITAQLDHPGIVAVHDAGTLPDEAPFYTMRLVGGATLAAALKAADGVSGRLGLLRTLLAACEAIGYAHRAGIVHRDIKPANILVGGLGETQVVDWGLARPVAGAEAAWMSALETGEAVNTRIGAVVGTPAYMSPEQASGGVVDARSDVFSLGAILFEMLTGAAPYADSDSEQALRRARAGVLPLERLRAEGTPPELAAICRRALSARPSQRYPDASALAAELVRWFEGRRVEAHAYSSAELLRRLLSLWRIPLAAAVLAVSVVSVAVVVSGWQIRAERDRALSAEAAAVSARQRSDELLADALLRQAILAVQKDDRAMAELLAVRAMSLGAEAQGRAVLAAFSAAERPQRVAHAEMPSCQAPMLSTDGHRMLCVDGTRLRMFSTDTMAVLWERPLVVTGAGDVILARSTDPLFVRTSKNIYQLDPDTGADQHLLAPRDEPILMAARAGAIFFGRTDRIRVAEGGVIAGPFSQECSELTQAVTVLSDGALVMLCDQGKLYVGPPEAPRLVAQTPFFDALDPTVVVGTPDARRLIIGGHRGDIGVVDVDTGAVRSLADSPVGSVRTIVPSPDGRWVAIAGARGTPRVLDPETGRWVATLPGEAVQSLGWDPATGDLLAAGGTLSRWRLPGSRAPYRLETEAGLANLAWSPDGLSLALARGDGIPEVVSMADGRSALKPVSFEWVTKAVAYSPDGAWFAATGMGGPRLWVTAASRGVVPVLSRSFRRLHFLADGRLFGAPFTAGLIALRPGRTKQADVHYNLDSEVVDINGPADGNRAAVLTRSNLVLEVVAGGGAPQPLATAPGGQAVDICADGQRFAVALRDGVHIRDRGGQLLLDLSAPNADLRDVAFSPDCSLVAAGGIDSLARVWSTTDGALIAELRGHTNRVAALAFDPAGQRLATASWDHSARIWDLRALRAPAPSLIASVLSDWGVELEDIGRYR